MAEHVETRRDWTDIIGGAALCAFGLWFAWHAQQEYAFGTARRMGPGYFPTVLGWMLAGMGLLVVLPALFRRGDLPLPALRPLFTIIAGGLAFAMIIEPAGLVPATWALVAIAAFAETRVRLLRTVILAAALALMAVSVFTWGLGIPVPAFRWGY